MIANRTSELTLLEHKWLKLFAEMRKCPTNGIDADMLAAPFLSTRLPGYDECGAGTVMLVGKATSGKNTLGGGPVQDTYDACTVKLRTPAVIEDVLSGIERSRFLQFARLLSDMVAKTTGIPSDPFTNLIWTNLIKIGVTRGNPEEKWANLHQDLAFETLLAEVDEYKPSLVVISTGWYCHGLVCRTLTEMVGSAPKPNDHAVGWWAHNAVKKSPAVLWTMHPAGKPHEVWEDWLCKAQLLLQT